MASETRTIWRVSRLVRIVPAAAVATTVATTVATATTITQMNMPCKNVD